MGLPASVWFVIALVALVLGALLLMIERRRITGTSQDWKRWAADRKWTYTDMHPLPQDWRFGTILQGGKGMARDLVNGALPGPPKRRCYVFHHDQQGTITSVIVAIETTARLPATVELHLMDSAEPPEDTGLVGHGPVGKRIAFVSDAKAAQPLITPRLAAAADEVGDDIKLVWAENIWILAVAPVGIDPHRAQDVLLALVEVAAALEATKEQSTPAEPSAATSTPSPRPAPESPEPPPESPTASPVPESLPASSAPPSTPSSPTPSPSPRQSPHPEGLDYLPRES